MRKCCPFEWKSYTKPLKTHFYHSLKPVYQYLIKTRWGGGPENFPTKKKC